MRLRTKYGLVLLVILVVLGTVVIGSAELFKQQTVDQEQAELEETTRLAAEQVGRELSDTLDDLRETGAVLDTEPGTSQRTQLDQFLDNTDYSVVLVTDSEGTIQEVRGLQPAQRDQFIGQHVTDQGFLDQETTENVLSGQSRIEQIQAINGSEDFFLTMGAPILDQEGNVEGALVGSVQITYGLHTGLFSPLRALETDQQTVAISGATYLGEQTTVLPRESEFDQVLASEAGIEGTDWTLTVERDEGALTNQLQFLQFIQLGSLLVVFLTVFGLGFYQYRTTIQQTNKLLDGFEELSDGNFTHSMDLETAKEWNQIGDGFNTMTSGLQRREQQIRERERRLSVLNRVLRHNLQNDLTVVQGYAEVLPPMDDKSQREEASDKILEKSRGLVEHGKKARRLETVMENAEAGTTEVNIGPKITESLDELQSEYPDFDVEFTKPENTWVDAVSGLEFGIEQLIENAFVHNDSDDPSVTVTIERTDDDVILTVKDNGSGIPDHEWEVLVQDEETSLEHGSGIGLWLAYWAVIKSNGDLEFGSQANGGHVQAKLEGCEAQEPETDDSLLDL
jgi:signal transduction histidine kinase